MVDCIGHCPADATVVVIQTANKKKVAVMISVIGKDTYETSRDLCSTDVVIRTRKIKRLRRYVIYRSDILSPSDWELRNRFDFRFFFFLRRKTKAF